MLTEKEKKGENDRLHMKKKRNHLYFKKKNLVSFLKKKHYEIKSKYFSIPIIIHKYIPIQQIPTQKSTSPM